MLTNLNSMSIEELWSLHEQLDSVLASKLSAEKAELEKKLGQRKTPRTMRDVLTKVSNARASSTKRRAVSRCQPPTQTRLLQAWRL